jgi:hypothetical protein
MFKAQNIDIIFGEKNRTTPKPQGEEPKLEGSA